MDASNNHSIIGTKTQPMLNKKQHIYIGYPKNFTETEKEDYHENFYYWARPYQHMHWYNLDFCKEDTERRRAYVENMIIWLKPGY